MDIVAEVEGLVAPEEDQLLAAAEEEGLQEQQGDQQVQELTPESGTAPSSPDALGVMRWQQALVDDGMSLDHEDDEYALVYSCFAFQGQEQEGFVEVVAEDVQVAAPSPGQALSQGGSEAGGVAAGQLDLVAVGRQLVRVLRQQGGPKLGRQAMFEWVMAAARERELRMLGEASGGAGQEEEEEEEGDKGEEQAREHPEEDRQSTVEEGELIEEGMLQLERLRQQVVSGAVVQEAADAEDGEEGGQLMMPEDQEFLKVGCRWAFYSGTGVHGRAGEEGGGPAQQPGVPWLFSHCITPMRVGVLLSHLYCLQGARKAWVLPHRH